VLGPRGGKIGTNFAEKEKKVATVEKQRTGKDAESPHPFTMKGPNANAMQKRNQTKKKRLDSLKKAPCHGGKEKLRALGHTHRRTRKVAEVRTKEGGGET